jgi:hypothetical protein
VYILLAQRRHNFTDSVIVVVNLHQIMGDLCFTENNRVAHHIVRATATAIDAPIAISVAHHLAFVDNLRPLRCSWIFFVIAKNRYISVSGSLPQNVESLLFIVNN